MNGVLLVFGAPCQFVAGRAGARSDHSISGHWVAVDLLLFLTRRPIAKC